MLRLYPFHAPEMVWAGKLQLALGGGATFVSLVATDMISELIKTVAGDNTLNRAHASRRTKLSQLSRWSSLV